MSKKDLIDAIAEEADMTKDKAGAAFDAMVGYIETTLKAGD
ncbi:MAG: HU family DNA-binding protein, partial [Pseudomonadota bacterium]